MVDVGGGGIFPVAPPPALEASNASGVGPPSTSASPDGQAEEWPGRRVLTFDCLELEKFLAFDRLKRRVLDDVMYSPLSMGRSCRKEFSDCTVSIFDPGSQDRTVMYVSSNYERVTGYTEASAVGSCWQCLQPSSPEVDEAFNGGEGRRIEAAIAERSVQDGPLLSLLLSERRDGSFVWNLLRLTFELVEEHLLAVALCAVVPARVPEQRPGADLLGDAGTAQWLACLHTAREEIDATTPAALAKLRRLAAECLDAMPLEYDLEGVFPTQTLTQSPGMIESFTASLFGPFKRSGSQDLEGVDVEDGDDEDLAGLELTLKASEALRKQSLITPRHRPRPRRRIQKASGRVDVFRESRRGQHMPAVGDAAVV